MSYVTVAWSLVASFALLLGLMYGYAWVMDRRARASLAFAICAFALVGVVIGELGMMYAATAAEWGKWVRWLHVPCFAVICALVVFVRLQLKAGRPWLMWTIIAIRCAVLLVNFTVPISLNFARIDSIETISFLGEQVTVVGNATPSPWQLLGSLSLLLLLIYLADASVTLWRSGSPAARRSAINVGSAIFLSTLFAILYVQLMVWEGMQLPALIAPPFLILLGAMSVRNEPRSGARPPGNRRAAPRPGACRPRLGAGHACRRRWRTS